MRELETFKKIHEKDLKKLEGEIEAYAARIPTMERSIGQLENELRKAKIDLDGEIRVCIVVYIYRQTLLLTNPFQGGGCLIDVESVCIN